MSISKRFRPLAALVLCFTMNAAYADEKQAAPEAEPPEEVGHAREVQPEDYYIAVVGKPMIIERLDWERFGNLRPWTIASHSKFDKVCMKECVPEGPACWNLCAREDPEAEIITVSNSCGFIRTTFDLVRLSPADGKRPKFAAVSDFAVYNTIGEWCKLGNRVREEGEGLLLGKWAESFYEITNFTVFEGTADSYFLSTSDFNSRRLENIKPMLVPIEEKNQVCYHLDDHHSDDAAKIIRPGLFRRRENEYYDICETHGLPVSKVLPAYKKLGYL